MFYLYRELHNVYGAENFTACKVTPKLFTVKFWAIFIKGIIYNDLNTNSNFRKCFKILQIEINPEKNTVDYTYTKQATGKFS